MESIILACLDPQGRLMLILHFYPRANGDLGASGLFDPKYLLGDDDRSYFTP